MKRFLVFLILFSFSCIYAREVRITDFNKKVYKFRGNLQSCDNQPHNAKEVDAQGMAHFEDDNVWFMSSKSKLKVYGGFFKRDKVFLLLQDDCSINENCYTYAEHLGDVDFDQEKHILYVPLEHLKFLDDYSGYSMYEWSSAHKQIELKKLVVLEEERGGSSAPYVAYNAIDKLVYLHGHHNTYGFLNTDKCEINRICGYNHETTEKTDMKTYIGDISAKITKEEESLRIHQAALEYLQSISEAEFKSLNGSKAETINGLCSDIATKAKCENRITKKISLSHEVIDFLNGDENFDIYKTTQWAEKVIIMTAECNNSNAWVKEPDKYYKILYNNMEYCEVDHELDPAFVKQGAAFSPNHRFLFYVHHSNKASQAVLHVYYFPDSEWVKFHEKNLNEPIYAVYVGIIEHEIDPTMAGHTNQELEGVDVWDGILNGRRCDLHEMMLNNNWSRDDEYYIWHWLFQDSDGDGTTDLYDNCIFDANEYQYDDDKDGIGNICDNCPYHSNPDQKDSDEDGAGDACDICPNFPNNWDIDEDGIPDKCDNCPYNHNPKQEDFDGDGIGDACDNCPYDENPRIRYEMNSEFILAEKKGARAKGFCKNIKSSSWEKHNVCMMQPDSDLDGTGDACDYGKIENGGFANSKIESVKPSSSISSWNELDLMRRKLIIGQYAFIRLDMPENSGLGLKYCKQTDKNNIECNAAVHYCAINYEQMVNQKLWGTRGYCSTAEKEGGSSMSGKNFGYSHGSDDFSQESIRSWEKRISIAYSPDDTNSNNWTPFVDSGDPNYDRARKPAKVSTVGEEVIWNWRRDWYEFNDCLGANKGSNLCQSLVSSGRYDVKNTMYYTLSTSILPISDGNLDPKEILSYTKYKNGELLINSAYFPPTNTNKFARASRYNIEANELNYHMKKCEMPTFPKQPPEIELCASCYLDIPIRYIGKNDILPYEYLSRYTIKKDHKNNVLLRTQRIVFPQNLVTFSELSKDEIIGVVSENGEYFISVNTSESGADWNKIGRIERWDSEIGEIETFAANYFIAKRQNGAKTLYKLDLTDESRQNEQVSDLNEIPENIYVLSNLCGIDYERARLVFANGRLYLFEQSSSNFKMYSYNGSNFEEIQGVMPPQRSILNIAASGRYIFLSGGTDFNNETMNDLWRFDTETNTWEQIPVTLQGDFRKVIMQEVEGKMVAFNPVIDDNTTFPVFEFENLEQVENIEVSYSEVKIENIDFEQTFCISETNKSVFPGITNVYGECVKVENYDFDEVTFPDYKLSVAGYKNSLYLGGLTGIRRLEIGENGEITKKEMTYSGKANNLAVYGNTLYAANYSEIDIFEIADAGMIERKSSVKTNNCENIRIENGKLFAAENKRVRIFDLTDPLSPELLETITLSGKAEDLEITENRLFVYENLNGLLTRKGKISVFDISDIENPQKNSELSQYCNDPEMQKSGNSVYLGCKNGTFKVTGSGLQGINGSKNYLRDSYVFDGILYQVFSGTLHKSQVKAEEIEEDGWI